MADPFSIVAGTVGVVDVCWRLGKLLRELQKGAAKIDDEIASLTREVEGLTKVTEIIRNSYRESQTSSHSDDVEQVGNLWRNIGSNIADAHLIVEELEKLIKSIAGDEPTKGSSSFRGRVHDFRKQLKKQSKDGDFSKLRHRLHTYYDTLQLMIELITLTQARQSHAVTSKSLEDIQSKLMQLQETVKRSDSDTVPCLVDPAALTSSNQHFSLPQPVEKNYTGRTSTLEEVRHAFTAPFLPGQDPIQRRIVIFGLGGSGKTQFCCRYAQMYRHSYWGVFWIDASSDESATQTYQEIAKDGMVDRSVRAAKHWLSNCKTQWLLIVDNADDPRLDLQKYFPEGERGHILITTRAPRKRRLGTVGPQSLHFRGLEQDDARSLLLHVAESKPIPWDSNTQKFAASITEALGFLPLAVMHAGKAIMNNLCKLDEYLKHHTEEKQAVRKARDLQGFQERDNIYMNVWSSYEFSLRKLEEKETMEADDALQLLKLFAFFHRDNIRVDFFYKAATNPDIERSELEKEDTILDGGGPDPIRKSWSSIFQNFMIQIVEFLYKERTPSVLPEFMRDSKAYHLHGIRLKEALLQLTQLSLITYNETNNSYSMHPVIHTWARERPKFHTMEQAVWCRAATIVLAQCIMFPPLASSEADEQLRRDLLPHIAHVRECQAEIDHRIKQNRQDSLTSWLHEPEIANRTDIEHMARFSRVYVQAGEWDEALRLQLSVEEYCLKWVGPEHTATMMIKLALSRTYWELSRGGKAAELQEQVLKTCESTLGRTHKRTLQAMDALGESRWLQGRFAESFRLHKKAYDGMDLTLGADREETLKALDHLGRVYSSLWRPERARAHLNKAIDGMKRNANLGPEHLDTLMAMNNLAITYLEDEGGKDSTVKEMNEGRRDMVEVLEKREKKLGKEHPFTLWALVNVARFKAAMGDLEEAKADIHASLAIAERNFDAQHLGLLFGRLHLGHVLLRMERYEEAENLLVEAAEGHQRRSELNGGDHFDHHKALGHLSTCFKMQRKRDEAAERCQEAIRGLALLGFDDHPFMEQLRSLNEELTGSRFTDSEAPIPLAERKAPHITKRASTFA